MGKIESHQGQGPKADAPIVRYGGKADISNQSAVRLAGPRLSIRERANESAKPLASPIRLGFR